MNGKLLTACLAVVILAALLPFANAEVLLRDGAGIITNESALNEELQEFSNAKGVIIYLETFEELEEVDATARANYKRYGLDKDGKPMFNLYIVYVEKSNELKIGYGSKCGLNLNNLKSAMDSNDVAGKIAEGKYDEAFSNLIDRLKVIVDKALDDTEGGTVCIIPSPEVSGNQKDMSLYTDKTVFLVSDKDWRDVLSLVPVAVWDRNGEECQDIYAPEQGIERHMCGYPFLIYHKEGDEYDLDSIQLFIKQYGAKRVIHLGERTDKLARLLPLDMEEIIFIPNMAQLFSYWKSYNEVIFVENKYESALLAAQYAAYRNAPLVIQGTLLDNINANQKVICIGDGKPQGTECDIKFSREDLQKEILRMTGNYNAIILNPNDIKDEYCENLKFVTNTGAKLNNLYCHDSLSAPYLAAAKGEIIVSVDLSPSHSLFDFNPTRTKFLLGNIQGLFIDIEDQSVYMARSFKEKELIVYPLKSNGDIGDSKYSQNLPFPILILHTLGIEIYKGSLYAINGQGADNSILLWQSIDDIKKGSEMKSFSLFQEGIEYPLDFSIYEDIIYVINTSQVCTFRIQDSETVVPVGCTDIDFGRSYAQTIDVSNGMAYLAVGTQLKVFSLKEDKTLGKIVKDVDFGETLDKLHLSFRDLINFQRITVSDEAVFMYEKKSKMVVKIRLSPDGIPFDNYMQTYGKGGDDNSGYFDCPTDMVFHKGYLYVTDSCSSFASDGLLILDVSSENPTHPDWGYFLPMKPKDTIPKIKDAILSIFPSIESLSSITFLASPKSIQFGTDEGHPILYHGFGSFFGKAYYISADSIIAELISNDLPPDRILSTEEREKLIYGSGDYERKPFGRIIFSTVSDASSYIARSIFSTKFENKPKNIMVLTGNNVKPIDYNEELEEFGNSLGFGFSCVNLQNMEECDNKYFNSKELEETAFLYTNVHGAHYGWEDFHFFNRDLRNLELNNLFVISESCANLDYYINKPESNGEYNLPFGIAFIRAGAIGFLGAVTPSGNINCVDCFRTQSISFLESSALGSLLTDKSWHKKRLIVESYLPWYTLIGDPIHSATW